MRWPTNREQLFCPVPSLSAFIQVAAMKQAKGRSNQEGFLSRNDVIGIGSEMDPSLAARRWRSWTGSGVRGLEAESATDPRVATPVQGARRSRR